MGTANKVRPAAAAPSAPLGSFGEELAATIEVAIWHRAETLAVQDGQPGALQALVAARKALALAADRTAAALAEVFR